MAGSSQMGQAADVMSGIGSALIATALGLGVAIVAVIFFNSFQSIVKHYEDDFQLIKLLFLSFVDGEAEPAQTKYQSSTSRVNL
jgi:biopolymer transport protein ExbB